METLVFLAIPKGSKFPPQKKIPKDLDMLTFCPKPWQISMWNSMANKLRCYRNFLIGLTSLFRDLGLMGGGEATKMWHKKLSTWKSQPLGGGNSNIFLGGGVKYSLFSPLFGEDSHFD